MSNKSSKPVSGDITKRERDSGETVNKRFRRRYGV